MFPRKRIFLWPPADYNCWSHKPWASLSKRRRSQWHSHGLRCLKFGKLRGRSPHQPQLHNCSGLWMHVRMWCNAEALRMQYRLLHQWLYVFSKAISFFLKIKYRKNYLFLHVRDIMVLSYSLLVSLLLCVFLQFDILVPVPARMVSSEDKIKFQKPLELWLLVEGTHKMCLKLRMSLQYTISSDTNLMWSNHFYLRPNRNQKLNLVWNWKH